MILKIHTIQTTSTEAGIQVIQLKTRTLIDIYNIHNRNLHFMDV